MNSLNNSPSASGFTRADAETLLRLLATAEGLDPDLAVRQCQQESSFQPNAVNPSSGAIGLMQLMPATARSLGVDPRRWHENVFGGVKLDGQLFRQFGGDPAKMLAAYNWGSGNLAKLLNDFPADWRNRLPVETANYLTKIL
jgi:soluble lytic murein transglycosylase-like protein